MFGYYDPASLSIEGQSAAIAFISAADANVRTVRIETADEARRIRDAIAAQRTMRITSLEGAMREIQGVVHMNPQHPDEGVMYTPAEPKRPIPIKLAFDGVEGIPEKGIAIVYGCEEDGAIRICRMAVRPTGPSPKLRSDPDTARRN
ncbi:hypothetical protein LAZ40_11675 [Cereibacter sphaeroides]|uniref:hypothetical protein n=1 Tax=Cereibacter sphaeroides TaxID=1063 RepID=UPI001F358218|nr:hypothetical protein [Cereibacter sphaeroides]MCE6959678.1 hypothetical protein [Cereibacter sphaeroides]MCE6974461.1 hypothetical protein [Cereibacter sphaeroides]